MKSIVAAITAVLILGIPGSAQSAADLLQKGIYAQETAGDLEGAIQLFRQVANPASTNKSIAAQAQYQLVLCMLQRGDRAAAAKEAETLARNFPDQQELVSKARKLLPGGGSGMLPAPWGESEVSQLNIKRAGAATGEYLYYSIDPGSVSATFLAEQSQSPVPALGTAHQRVHPQRAGLGRSRVGAGVEPTHATVRRRGWRSPGGATGGAADRHTDVGIRDAAPTAGGRV